MGRRFAPVADRMQVYKLVREAVSAGHFVGATDFIRQNKNSGYNLPPRQTVSRWALGETSPLSGKRLFDGRPSEAPGFLPGSLDFPTRIVHRRVESLDQSSEEGKASTGFWTVNSQL